MKTSSSTQSLEVSGRDRANSSGSLPSTTGRITKNSRKAATPLILCSSPSLHNKQRTFSTKGDSLCTHPPTPSYFDVSVPAILVDPPPHPENDEPVVLQSTPVRSYQDRQSPFSSLNLPSIKQLREFPNLSAPVLVEQGKSVIVRLPHSAPVSPVKSNQSNCSIKSGDPITPTRSPELGVSVILANPTFVPAPPLPKFSTPTRNAGSPVVGSWDNFLEHPTYQNCDEIFWETRNKNTYKIPIVSTDLSDLESSAASLNLHDLNCLEEPQPVTIVGGITPNQLTIEMEANRDRAMHVIKSLQERVQDTCDDLDPNLITEFTASHMSAKLNDITTARDQYRSSVRNFLETFKEILTEPDAEKLRSEMKSVLANVRSHESVVFTKITQVTAKPVEMTEFEKTTIELQRKQIQIQQETIDSQRKEVLAAASPLRKLILEKCSALDGELELVTVTQLQEGDEQQVTRIMLKLAGWRTQLESITSMHQELLTKTALHELPASEKSEVTAAVETTKASLETIATTAEDEDVKRQLYSLDTSHRGEQVKWPIFGGESGEDFYKFRREFYDAAKENRTSLKNQVSKLRENLKGYAKSLIAPSITDVT